MFVVIRMFFGPIKEGLIRTFWTVGVVGVAVKKNPMSLNEKLEKKWQLIFPTLEQNFQPNKAVCY